MIEFAKSSDYGEIADLWHKTFGDDYEFINKFLSFFGKYAVVLKEEKLNAMMFLLPVYSNNKKGRYVYAVAVKEELRNKGLGKKLIEFAKDFIKADEFLVLVPASKTLFSYYEKLGFYINTPIYEETEAKNHENISALEYFNLREKYFENSDFIRWNKNDLENIKILYNAEFVKNKDGIFIKSGKKVLEFLPNDKKSSKKQFSMIFPENELYFNIAID